MNDYESTFREYWNYVKDFFRNEFGKKIDEGLPPIMVVKKGKIVWYSKEAQGLVDLINRPTLTWDDGIELKMKQNSARLDLHFPGAGHCNTITDCSITYVLDDGQDMPKEDIIVHEMVHRAGIYFNPEGSDLRYLGENEYTTEFTTWLILSKYKGRDLKEIPLEEERLEVYLAPRRDLRRIGNYEKGIQKLNEILSEKPF